MGAHGRRLQRWCSLPAVFRSVGHLVGIVALSIASLSGCDDSDAKKPAPPLPEIGLKLHGHFGRPGATLGLVLRGTESKADVSTLLAQATGLQPDLVGLADLLQPADLFVIEMAGARHRLVSFTPTPKLEQSLPEGYRLEVEPKARGGRKRVVAPDGKTRCVSASERLVCGASAQRLGEVADELQPVVIKWARDHTDAVVEVRGDFLREAVLPAIAGDLAIVRDRLGARLARGLDDPVLAASALALGGARVGADLPTRLADVERAVFRLRIDGRQARLEARVDFDPDGESVAARATAARHRASPLASVLGKLPAHAHALLVDAASALGDGVLLGALRERIEGGQGETLAEKLEAFERSLAPGYALALVWRGEDVVVVEAQRSRAPERTAEALAALSGSVPARGEQPAVTLGPASAAGLEGTRRIVMGERRALLALVDGVVLVASGHGVEEEALATAITSPRKASELGGMAATLAPQTFGIGVDLSTSGARDPEEHGGGEPLIFGYRVAEKTPDSLRGAALLETRHAGLVALARMIRDGRAGHPDPLLAPRGVAEDGSTD